MFFKHFERKLFPAYLKLESCVPKRQRVNAHQQQTDSANLFVLVHDISAFGTNKQRTYYRNQKFDVL